MEERVIIHESALSASWTRATDVEGNLFFTRVCSLNRCGQWNEGMTIQKSAHRSALCCFVIYCLIVDSWPTSTPPFRSHALTYPLFTCMPHLGRFSTFFSKGLKLQPSSFTILLLHSLYSLPLDLISIITHSLTYLFRCAGHLAIYTSSAAPFHSPSLTVLVHLSARLLV